jgi:hypothetical protein
MQHRFAQFAGAGIGIIVFITLVAILVFSAACMGRKKKEVANPASVKHNPLYFVADEALSTPTSSWAAPHADSLPSSPLYDRLTLLGRRASSHDSVVVVSVYSDTSSVSRPPTLASRVAASLLLSGPPPSAMAVAPTLNEESDKDGSVRDEHAGALYAVVATEALTSASSSRPSSQASASIASAAAAAEVQPLHDTVDKLIDREFAPIFAAYASLRSLPTPPPTDAGPAPAGPQYRPGWPTRRAPLNSVILAGTRKPTATVALPTEHLL